MSLLSTGAFGTSGLTSSLTVLALWPTIRSESAQVKSSDSEDPLVHDSAPSSIVEVLRLVGVELSSPSSSGAPPRKRWTLR
jgi:hypothetical protein